MNDILNEIQNKIESGYLGDDIDEVAKVEATEYGELIEKDVDINDLLQSNIVCSNSGSNIKSIINSLEEGYYVIPPFQRRFVWNKSKIAYLALSIIQSVPIPPIYVYTNEERKQVVLDGQQRMIAIFLYFNDLEYVKSDNHINFKTVSILNKELRSLESEERKMKELQSSKKEINDVRKNIIIKEKLLAECGMKRCSYCIDEDKDISFSLFAEKNRDYLLQKRLDITLVESRDLKCIPHKTFSNIFKLLNSGGKPLGPQEVRNGVFWDTILYEKIYEINESHNTWRKIYGGISVFSKDMEILLKMVALCFYSCKNKDGNYEIDIQRFSWANIMDSYSEMASEKKGEVTNEVLLLEKYLDAIELDTNVKCQRAVFEAMFVAYSKACLPDDFKISYDWLCSKRFEKVSSNKSSVEDRINKAVEWLKEICSV